MVFSTGLVLSTLLYAVSSTGVLPEIATAWHAHAEFVRGGARQQTLMFGGLLYISYICLSLHFHN